MEIKKLKLKKNLQFLSKFRLLERYLIREVWGVWMVATPVIILLLMGIRVSKKLAEAAAGALPAEAVWGLVWLKVPAYLGMVVPMTLFFSVLLALGRWSRDSELVSALAGGMSVLRLSRALLWLAAAVAVVVGLLVNVATPWASQEMNRIYDEVEASANFVGVMAGRFKEISGKGENIFYTEEMSADQSRMRGIFYYHGEGGEYRVVTAKEGLLMPSGDGKGRWLKLTEGKQYQGRPGSAAMEMVEFDEYSVRLLFNDPIIDDPRGREVSLSKLLEFNSLRDYAEVQWRIALPLMTVLLVFLALSLTQTFSRQGRYVGLIPGVLLYLLYSNLLNVSYSWIEEGTIPPIIGMNWVHLLFIGITAWMFHQQGTVSVPWLEKLRRKGTKS